MADVHALRTVRSLAEMTTSELEDWVRLEVTTQTQLLRDQVEVLRRGLDVLAGQLEHQQRVLEMVGKLARGDALSDL